jgi:phthalate 4,5-cis-dihydrodiol dehydrogenase
VAARLKGTAAKNPLRVGVAGLGVASSQVLPAFREGAPYVLTGGADTSAEARKAFTDRYGKPAFNSVTDLCTRGDVDAVWISTPNTVHMEHTIAAARAGKHVICEKPMAVTLQQCDRMIRACEDAGVHYLQGHSKIYQAPMKAMRRVIRSGRLGRVVQIHAANFNDWLQRPRLAPELDTTKGGGIVYRQGPHIIDIVRFLGGGMVRNVRGISGRADRYFDTEGHFSALMEFDDGATANVTFNGYGYFDVTELTWGIGESGRLQTGARAFPRADKPRLRGAADPARKRAVANDRGDHASGNRTASEQHQPFFGLTVVFCEKGAIRQAPDGIYVYTQKGREEIPLPAGHGRSQELQELVDAIAQCRPAFPDGHWGKATLEVCLAIMASGRDGKVRRLKYQVPAP